MAAAAAVAGGASSRTLSRVGSLFGTLSRQRQSVVEMLSGQAFLELLDDQDIDTDERDLLREKARLRLIEEAKHLNALRAQHANAQVRPYSCVVVLIRR